MTPARKAYLPASRSKFGNRKVRVGSILFDSRREAARFAELQLLERAGQITDLALKPRYVLTKAGSKLGTYTPDFQYRKDGALVVEDVKSPATITDIFKWKAKHLLAEHGLKVEVVF